MFLEENKSTIHSIYKDIFVEIANERLPFKRTPKFDHSYIFDMISTILRRRTNWKCLDQPNTKDHHYSIIQKRFYQYNKCNIFQDSYYEMLNVYGYDVNRFDEYKFVSIIDATYIDNKTGREMVTIHPENFKKKVTKLVIISDVNKIPLAILPFNGSESDVNTLNDMYIELHSKLDIYKTIQALGDKGYRLKDSHKECLKTVYNIDPIIPYRKNQKQQLPKHRKQLLRNNRIYIENTIQTIKKYDRLKLRKDHKIINYNGFVFLGIGLTFSERFMK